MISTKGRYSIRVLLDLAEHRSGDFIPMKEVAARQDISLKYIERLMPVLKSAGLVESVRHRRWLPPDAGAGGLHPLGDTGAGGGRSGARHLSPAGRAGVPAGRGVPDAGRVAGILQADAGLLHPHHAGGSDERPSRGQLCDISEKEPPAGGSFLPVQG